MKETGQGSKFLSGSLRASQFIKYKVVLHFLALLHNVFFGPGATAGS